MHGIQRHRRPGPRDSRLIGLLTGATAGLACFAVWRAGNGLTAAADESVLRVRKLELTDAAGKVVGRLAAEDEGTDLTLLGADGKLRAQLLVDRTGVPRFALQSGKSYCLVRFFPDGRTELEMSGGQGAAVEVLAAGDQGAVQLGAGKSRVVVSSSKDAKQLTLSADSVVATDADGKATVKLK